ncbi:hypothetical protein BDZ89DRAFT_1116439 [Hymenopellis radicata]|nr:hypothetical protein BDZ89DRAFT_1116439 [Hymenopellis radicata]
MMEYEYPHQDAEAWQHMQRWTWDAAQSQPGYLEPFAAARPSSVVDVGSAQMGPIGDLGSGGYPVGVYENGYFPGGYAAPLYPPSVQACVPPGHSSFQPPYFPSSALQIQPDYAQTPVQHPVIPPSTGMMYNATGFASQDPGPYSINQRHFVGNSTDNHFGVPHTAESYPAYAPQFFIPYYPPPGLPTMQLHPQYIHAVLWGGPVDIWLTGAREQGLAECSVAFAQPLDTPQYHPTPILSQQSQAHAE